MTKIALHTLGCKSNQYDTECIADACRRPGDYCDSVRSYIQFLEEYVIVSRNGFHFWKLFFNTSECFVNILNSNFYYLFNKSNP